jgi:RNA polymerase sigma-70 factor (ECF subfamily)
MPNSSLDTTQLHGWLARIRAGDLPARDELLRAVCGRLERLARAMLRRYPRVRDWAETGDVFQNAVLRLLRALQEVSLNSTRDLFNLAAAQMRRELIDLARHFYGPHGAGANQARPNGQVEGAGARRPLDLADRAQDPEDLERWSAFHEAVEKLPTVEREVLGLAFYQGWTQPQIADLLQVDERTVRRRWGKACAHLHEALGGNLPRPSR